MLKAGVDATRIVGSKPHQQNSASWAVNSSNSSGVGIKEISWQVLFRELVKRLTTLRNSPGSGAGQKDVGKRLRIVLLAVFIPTLFAFFRINLDPYLEKINPFLLSLGLSSLLAIITYLSTILAFRLQIKRESSFTSVLFPSLFVFAFSFFLETIFITEFFRITQATIFIFLIFAFMLSLYFILLAANIINVSLYKEIPLSEVGYTVMYFSSLLFTYLITWAVFFTMFSTIQSSHLVVFAGGIVLAIFYFLSYLAQFYLFVSTATEAGNYAFGLTVVSIYLLLILTLTPISLLILALAPVLVRFIAIGLFIHRAKGQIPNRVVVEYLIFLAIYFSVIFWVVLGL